MFELVLWKKIPADSCTVRFKLGVFLEKFTLLIACAGEKKIIAW